MALEAANQLSSRVTKLAMYEPKGKQYVGVLGPAKGGVSYTIFNTQSVDAPADLFGHRTRVIARGDRKTIKIRQDQAVDHDMLAGLIAQTVPA